jgi:Glycosyl hydrolase family 3 C-terminal domain
MDIQQWVNQVPGLIHAIFPGEDGGIALGEILFGDVNPSGKLPFTFEKRFQDNPAYPNYPSVDGGVTAIYKEGLFMGYRGFDKYGTQPQFPFGYGLSYTTFAYSDLKVTPTSYNNSSSEGLGNNSEVKRSGFAAAIGTRNGKQNTLGACTLLKRKNSALKFNWSAFHKARAILTPGIFHHSQAICPLYLTWLGLSRFLLSCSVAFFFFKLPGSSES